MTKQQTIKKTREWARTLCCNEIELGIVFRKFSKKEIADYEKAKADQWKGYFEERFVSQMAKIITRL